LAAITGFAFFLAGFFAAFFLAALAAAFFFTGFFATGRRLPAFFFFAFFAVFFFAAFFAFLFIAMLALLSRLTKGPACSPGPAGPVDPAAGARSACRMLGAAPERTVPTSSNPAFSAATRRRADATPN
jgi:hypothetical protein